jgi:hypothetical protein
MSLYDTPKDEKDRRTRPAVRGTSPARGRGRKLGKGAADRNFQSRLKDSIENPVQAFPILRPQYPVNLRIGVVLISGGITVTEQQHERPVCENSGTQQDPSSLRIAQPKM